MWIYALFIVALGSVIGLILYSIENKISFKRAIYIKWEAFRLLIKIKRSHIKPTRIGIGSYFIQIDISHYWCLILRIGDKGYVINKLKGFHIRNYNIF